MSTGGPFPQPNTDFDAYVNIAVPYVTLPANATRLGVSTGHVTTLGTLLTNWNAVFPLAENPATATTSILHQRDTLRGQLEDELRAVYADIPESVFTEDDRATLNIPEGDSTPTASQKPTVAPVVTIDKIHHLQHTLRFQNPETPESRAKPEGVSSVEIYAYVTDNSQPVPGPQPEPKESDFHHVASTGRFLYTIDFSLGDEGRKIYYVCRYRSTRGEFGPFSVVVWGIVA